MLQGSGSNKARRVPSERLYASVLVHGLSHWLVVRAFGWPLRRVLLYPLPGFSEIERECPGQIVARSWNDGVALPCGAVS
jgi:hypothetical protein